MTELTGIVFANVLAIKASEVEQTDNTNPANIINNNEKIELLPMVVRILFGMYT